MTTPEFKLPRLTIRQTVQATALLILVAAAFYFVYRFHLVFLLLFVAIVFSTALRPIVLRLNKLGVPKEAGVALVYICLLGIAAAVILLLMPIFVSQGSRFIDTIPNTYQETRERMLENPNYFVWRMATEMPERLNLTPMPEPPTEEEDVIETVGQNLELLGLGGRAIFFVLAILLLAFYWTLDGQKNLTALLLLVPLEHRENAREIIQEIQNRLGAFIQGQTLLGLVIGSLSFVAYLLIGLPYSLALAIIAGIMEMIPVIGPILGAVPAIIIAYTISPEKVLWVLLATTIIQQLENNFLVPRVMKHSVGVNPLVTLLALTAFGTLFGFLGALVAIPLAAIIQLLLDRFVIESAVPDENSVPGRDKISVLRYDVQELTNDIRKAIRQKDSAAEGEAEEVEDTIEAIAADLDSTLAARQEKREEKN